MSSCRVVSFSFFVFNDPATTSTYTLSLHDALPILQRVQQQVRRDGALALGGIEPAGHRREVHADGQRALGRGGDARGTLTIDRKSTRLNSSHVSISYAVFCLKKKTERNTRRTHKHH